MQALLINGQQQQRTKQHRKISCAWCNALIKALYAFADWDFSNDHWL
jgi:hypothetical protein